MINPILRHLELVHGLNEMSAAFAKATFSCENRHFALFVSQIEKETRAIYKEIRQNADSRSLK